MTPPWAIVLAGGQGARLRPLVRQVCGEERPKQFANIMGSKSLLRQTLDRVALRITPQRTLVITCHEHEEYVQREFPDTSVQQILSQPDDRGTAAGILFPAHWIHSIDPDAVAAVFPSDHFILEEEAFMEQILRVSSFARREPKHLVLLGATAVEPETEYGWIEPGELVGRTDSGIPIRLVRQFWEKPLHDTARRCLAIGCLWNTLVFVAKVSTLIELGRTLLPDLAASMARITCLLSKGRQGELESEWNRIPKADFSATVLQRCPSKLAVSPLTGVTWSDLGSPGRVIQALKLIESSRTVVA